MLTFVDIWQGRRNPQASLLVVLWSHERILGSDQARESAEISHQETGRIEQVSIIYSECDCFSMRAVHQGDKLTDRVAS